jgi:hypothetical protein
LPELVYIGQKFNGNKVLVEEAIAAGQVERYYVGKIPWLKNATQNAYNEQGSHWQQKLSVFGEVDDEAAKEMTKAIEDLNWTLPKVDAPVAKLALTQGKVPEGCYDALEEAMEASNVIQIVAS